MAEVTIRELRNRGWHVLERVAAGERLVLTRDGRPMAQILPIPPIPTSATELLARWRRLPPLDPAALRADLDAIVKPHTDTATNA